jgi:tRNA modification GTPase
MPENHDTIAAIATPAGAGGIGVIRVSGQRSKDIYKTLTNKTPKPRFIQYTVFRSSNSQIIDKGIALFFQAPSSYTGEDVVEFHLHGNRIVLGMLLDEIIALGARAARPGQFTERAFLNGKIDLIQAEAVADLIESNSKKAARGAMQSLDGIFSNKVKSLREAVFNAKSLFEASLDFPDEEDIDINIEPAIENIHNVLNDLDNLIYKAESGRALSQNPSIVIVGSPNAGKSSIINYLSGFDSAIVSPTPGTTRDIIRENVLLADYAVTLVDTAGIRETSDAIEKEGVTRALKVLGSADIVLYVIDQSISQELDRSILEGCSSDSKLIIVRNKIDLCDDDLYSNKDYDVYVSAKTGVGLDKLKTLISSFLDTSNNEEDMIFARKRHVDALMLVKKHIQDALSEAEQGAGIEVIAESLRQGLAGFDEVTGKTTSDDVLGNIFSRFCIGK